MGDILKKCAEVVDEQEKLTRERDGLLAGIEQLENAKQYYQQDIDRLRLKVTDIEKRLKELG